MWRRFVWVVSGLSLMIGLVSAPFIDAAIRGYLAAKGLPEYGGTYFVLWTATYAIVLAAVLVLAMSWQSLLVHRRRAERTRAREGPQTVREKVARERWARQERELKRLALQKVLDTADDILRMLDTLYRELATESTFNQDALSRLQEAVEKGDMVIGQACRAIMGKGTHRFAPEVGTLLHSITKHSHLEIVSVFRDPGLRSQADVQTKIHRAIWGVQCVRLLIEQLQETVAGHAVCAGQRAT